jgi:hypothetical protein
MARERKKKPSDELQEGQKPADEVLGSDEESADEAETGSTLVELGPVIIPDAEPAASLTTFAGFGEGATTVDAMTPPTREELIRAVEAAVAPYKDRPVVMSETKHTEIKAALAEPNPGPSKKERPMFSEPDKDLEQMDLVKAASTMMVGFKPHWVHALRAKANSMGITGPLATKREWRRVFVAWGGPSYLA